MLHDSALPPTTSSALSTDLRRLPGISALAGDYCHDYEHLQPFYVGNPTDPSQWNHVIAQRQATQSDPKKVAEIVIDQLRSRQAPTAALSAASHLAETSTIAIVTGQQAGLFGGPLYTLLKGLTAIALARRVAADHDVRVVPVFWVDAEDHDLDEIRTCPILDSKLALHQISLDLPKSGKPASQVTLPTSVGKSISDLSLVLAKTEFSEEVLEGLGATYKEGTGIVEAFSRWLDNVLGVHGLVVFDSSDTAAKPLVERIFVEELRSRGATSRLAAAAGQTLQTRGYHAQVTPGTGAVSLFKVDGAREPIRLRLNDFVVGETTFSLETLLQQVHDHPDSFSPNVLLRPIIQDSIFPTVAYVTGPSELAYLGQLKEAYAQFSVPMPLMYPRLSATLVDRTIVKFLSKYDVPFETLHAQDDRVLNRLLKATLPSSLENAVKNAEREIDTRLSTIGLEVPAVDPTLTGVVQTTRGRLERDLNHLRGKIIQAAKRRDETLQRQFQRVRAQTFPDGELQERTVAGVYFLNRYGPGMIEHLLEQVPLNIGHHWLLTV